MREEDCKAVAQILREFCYYMDHDQTEYSVTDCMKRNDLYEDAQVWIQTFDMEYPYPNVRENS